MAFSLPPNYEALWERMAELCPADPGASRFGGLIARRISGPLDDRCLLMAVGDVTRRHEILRLEVVEAGCDPLVTVLPDVEPVTHVIDLSGGPEERRRRELADLVYRETHQVFDLSTAPLWAVYLVHLSDDEHLLLLSFCHLLLDGQSGKVMFEEIIHSYLARLGRHGPLPPVAMDLAEISRMQARSLIKPDEMAKDWAQRLWIPGKRVPWPVREADGDADALDDAVHAFTLDHAVVSALEKLAWRNRSTVFTLLMAAYQLLVSLRAETSKVIVSSTLRGRNLANTRRLLGQFTRDIFVPVEVRLGDCLGDVMEAAQRSLAEAAEHAMSFTCLARAMHPGSLQRERPWSDLNLFDSYINPAVTDLGESVYGDLRVDHVELTGERRPGDPPQLTVGELSAESRQAWIKHVAPYVIVDDDRRGGVIAYNRSFFDPAVIEGIAAEYVALIGLLAADPARPVRALRPVTG